MQAISPFLKLLACLVTCGGIGLSSYRGTSDLAGGTGHVPVAGFELIVASAPHPFHPDCVFLRNGESEIEPEDIDPVELPPGFSQPVSEAFTYQRTCLFTRSLGDRVSALSSPVALILRC